MEKNTKSLQSSSIENLGESMKAIRRKCSSRPIHIIDESLRPKSVDFLEKRLSQYIKNFNDYIVYEDENNLEVDANILEIVSIEQLDNYISEFEWLVNAFNDTTLFLTPKRIQIKNQFKLGKQIFSFNTALQKTKITHKKAIEILKDR